MERPADFQFCFPGISTRMYDGQQKIHLDILTHIALDGPRSAQDAEALGPWKSFWKADRGVLTSVDMLVQSNMHKVSSVNKVGIDGLGWVKEVSPAHLTVQTNHSTQDSENTHILMDTILKLEEKFTPLKSADPVPNNAAKFKYKVRWTDLGTSGKAEGPYFASLAYDVITAASRAGKLPNIDKNTRRYNGVRHMALQCYSEAVEMEELEAFVWVVEKPGCPSPLIELPGRKEENDGKAKVTAICRVVRAGGGGEVVAEVQYQFQTERNWNPWIKVTGEGTEDFEYP